MLKRPSFVGIIWRPQVELERIKGHPIIWIPLIILCLVHVIAMLFATRVKTEQWDLNAVQTPPNISYTYMSTEMWVSDLLSFVLGICLVTLLLYGIAKAFHVSVTMRTLFSLSIFLQVIPTIGLIFQAIAHVIEWKTDFFGYSLQDVFQLPTGLLSVALSYVTIFTIWNWIIATIGYKKIINIPLSVAVVTTFVVWYLPLFIYSVIRTPLG